MSTKCQCLAVFVRIYEQQMAADLYEAIGIGFNSYSKPMNQAKLSGVVVSILLQLQENVSHKPFVATIILRNVGLSLFPYILEHM